jgi:DNA-binding transcriptional regulator LsrR (DeoR family)
MLPLNQSELAEELGTTRSNVNRQLSRWQRDGIVALRQGRLFLLRAEALEDLSKSG